MNKIIFNMDAAIEKYERIIAKTEPRRRQSRSRLTRGQENRTFQNFLPCSWKLESSRIWSCLVSSGLPGQGVAIVTKVVSDRGSRHPYDVLRLSPRRVCLTNPVRSPGRISVDDTTRS